MKKKKSGNSSSKGFLKKWNGYWDSGLKNDKGKISAGKAVVKPLAGIATGVAGSGFGALSGSISPWIGLGLLITGQLIPDKSKLVSILGASMLSWGIARGVQNRAADEANSVNGLGSLAGTKDRLMDFKDNFLTAFRLDKLTKSKDDETTDSDQTMGAIDLSALDAFEDLTKQSAFNFEMRRAQQEEEDEEFEDEFEDEDEIDEDEFEDEEEDGDGIDEDDLDGLNFSMIEEELDMVL